MNTDYIFLNPAPMPYLTDCDYKKFEPNEYHISRIVDFFVLIFMLRGSLHFIEDDVSVSVQEGEWYIQRKNLLQGADRPSTGKNIASAIKNAAAGFMLLLYRIPLHFQSSKSALYIAKLKHAQQ